MESAIMHRGNQQGKILRQMFLLACLLVLVGFSVWVIWFCCKNETPRAAGLLAIPVVFVMLYCMVKNAI